jgi:hypothetical protein
MSKTLLQNAIIGLGTVTALVHLWLGVTNFGNPDPNMSVLSYLFILNSFGYFTLLAWLFWEDFPIKLEDKAMSHFLLMIYAAITLVAYFILNGQGTLGYITKTVEVLLIAATFFHLRAS